MKAAVRDSQALRLVTPEDLEQYLTSHQWIVAGRSGRLGAIYNRQIDGNEFELLVPLTRDFEDFAERISEILRTLEVVEKRSQLQILSDLYSVRSDVVRVRRAEAADGTILLEDGVSLVASAYNMVLAAACTTVAPKVYYPGKKPPTATDYLHKMRLGQSERGSYVLTVISPLPPRGAPDLVPGLNDPFERQVTRMLAGALEATVGACEQALRRGTADAFRDSTNQGVSANLLDAVVGLMGGGYRSVEVNFAWSPEHPIIGDLHRTVTIESEFVTVLQEASRQLKESAELPPIELIGVVVGLRRPEGADEGRATLLAFVDGRPKNVTLTLGNDNYDLAIRAHQLRAPVMVKGKLKRFGRATLLTEMSGFRLAPEDSTEQPAEDETLF
jgi:hypothetical protein